MLLLTLVLPSGTVCGKAGELSAERADSLSLNYYMAADWDKLLALGKLAQKEGIDFKILQQRLGYAYFMKKKYYKSMHHYSLALKYEPQDSLSLLYMYYNGLNTGLHSYARYYASKLAHTDYKQYTGESRFRMLDAVDLEYSYKRAAHDRRSNAEYQRVGINSLLGYKWSLYQSVSRFRQRSESTNLSKQNEYLALLSWTPLEHFSFAATYHYVDTKVIQEGAIYSYPGQILFGKADFRHQRLLFSLSTSDFSTSYLRSTQLGAHLGLGFAGDMNTYFKSSLYRVFENKSYEEAPTQRFIFKQTAGIMLLDQIWTEASLNLGNMDNFVDLDGLYVYNSLDRSTFRSGLTTFWYINHRWTVFLNYTYDTKNIVLTNEFYNQQSITGGLLWKL